MNYTDEQQEALRGIGPALVDTLKETLPGWCFVLLLAPRGSHEAVCLSNAEPKHALGMMAEATKGLEQVGAEIEAAAAKAQGSMN